MPWHPVRGKLVEDTHLVADIESIVALGVGYAFCIAVLVLILEVAIEEHAFTFRLAGEVLVAFQAAVFRIFLELGNRAAELVVVGCAVDVETGLECQFGIGHTPVLKSEIEVSVTGKTPPPRTGVILPVGITIGTGVSEDDFLALVVVPVEGSVPTRGDTVGAVFAVDDFLGIFGAFGVLWKNSVNLPPC